MGINDSYSKEIGYQGKDSVGWVSLHPGQRQEGEVWRCDSSWPKKICWPRKDNEADFQSWGRCSINRISWVRECAC